MLSRLRNFKTMNNNNLKTTEYENKRSTPRRKCDQCVSEVNGQNYPVEDWSMGGVKVFGDFRTYNEGQELPVVMKFKLRDDILSIPHAAQIVRKRNDGVALQFIPLTKDVRSNFQKVIDDYNTREFAGSFA